jgi:hypothetical protein
MGAIQLGRLAQSRPTIVATNDIVIDDIDHAVFSRSALRQQGKQDGGTQAALMIIAAFVPGEALAFYVTASALLGSATAGTDLAIASATLAIVAVLVLTAHATVPEFRRSPRRLCLALVFALFGAAVYLAAMPNSAAHQWKAYTPQVSAVVVVAASILMPPLANYFGLRADRS